MTAHQTTTSITCDRCERDGAKRYYEQHKFRMIAGNEDRLRQLAMEAGWTFTPRRFLCFRWERILCPKCSK